MSPLNIFGSFCSCRLGRLSISIHCHCHRNQVRSHLRDRHQVAAPSPVGDIDLFLVIVVGHLASVRRIVLAVVISIDVYFSARFFDPRSSRSRLRRPSHLRRRRRHRWISASAAASSTSDSSESDEKTATVATSSSSSIAVAADDDDGGGEDAEELTTLQGRTNYCTNG